MKSKCKVPPRFPAPEQTQPRVPHSPYHRRVESVGAFVPWFHGGRFAPWLERSLLAQSPAFDQVVVVDDSPNDPDAVAFVNRLRTAGLSVELLQHEKNCGLSTSHATAIQALDSDWMTVVPQDDVFSPRFTSTVHRLRKRHSRAVAFAFTLRIAPRQGLGDPRLVIPIGNETWSQIDLLSQLFQRNTLTAPGMTLRLASVSSAFWSPTNHSCQDWESWLYLATRGAVIASSSRVVMYRRSPDSLSATTAGLIAQDWDAALSRYSSSDEYKVFISSLRHESAAAGHYLESALALGLKRASSVASHHGTSDAEAPSLRRPTARRLLVSTLPTRLRQQLSGSRLNRRLREEIAFSVEPTES